MRVSIIINNFNYALYLGACIDSALAQSYPHLEVIVVDDGSTDGSRAVVESYGERVRGVFKENGGQGSAYNAGFALSTGEIVLFLDADDVLLPTAISEVVSAWREDTAKVHFRLRIIDGDGVPKDGTVPTSLHDGDVVRLIRTFGSYASPPASGNAYARRALEAILPMPEAQWRISADAYAIFLVPFYGRVVSLDRVLGLYRVREKKAEQGNPNRSLVFNNCYKSPSAAFARAYGMTRLVISELLRRGLLAEKPKYGITPSHSRLRLISLKFSPEEHPIPNDTIRAAVADALPVALLWPGYRPCARLCLVAWIVTMALLPAGIARTLAVWAVNPAARPHLVSRLRSTLRAVGVV